MNYLWEVLLRAKQQGIKENSIRFVMAKNYSAYMEIAGEFLNQDTLEKSSVVEVNPYFRFYDIFKDLYAPELQDYPKLRDSLTHLLLHQLAQNDVLSGMTREEYYKKLLFQDLEQGAFGERAVEAIRLFERDEQEVVLSGMLRQYQTGSSLDIFKDMMEELVPNNIVYHSNNNFYEILVYIGRKKEEKLALKIEFLIQMFIDLPYHVDVYYEYHFGIIGVSETMKIDEIALY